MPLKGVAIARPPRQGRRTKPGRRPKLCAALVPYGEGRPRSGQGGEVRDPKNAGRLALRGLRTSPPCRLRRLSLPTGGREEWRSCVLCFGRVYLYGIANIYA